MSPTNTDIIKISTLQHGIIAFYWKACGSYQKCMSSGNKKCGKIIFNDLCGKAAMKFQDVVNMLDFTVKLNVDSQQLTQGLLCWVQLSDGREICVTECNSKNLFERDTIHWQQCIKAILSTMEEIRDEVIIYKNVLREVYMKK